MTHRDVCMNMYASMSFYMRLVKDTHDTNHQALHTQESGNKLARANDGLEPLIPHPCEHSTTELSNIFLTSIICLEYFYTNVSHPCRC